MCMSASDIIHEQQNATKEYRIQTVAIHCEIECISCNKQSHNQVMVCIHVVKS